LSVIGSWDDQAHLGTNKEHQSNQTRTAIARLAGTDAMSEAIIVALLIT
jgi:hypothetical protein